MTAVYVITSFGALSIITLVSIIACFLPFILDWKLQSTCDLGNAASQFPTCRAIYSNSYLMSLVASVSMSIHMLVDLLGHSFLSQISNFLYNRDSASNLLVLISLLVPDFVQIFYVIPYHDPLVFHLIHLLRNVMIFFATFGFLTKFGGNNWRTIGVIFAVIFVNIGLLLKFYGYFISGKSSSLLAIISSTFLIIGTFLLFVKTITWIADRTQQYRLGIRMTTDEYSCNIYLLAFWISDIWYLCLILQSNLQDWYNFNTSVSVQLNMLFSVYYILIAVFQRHAAIREAVTYSVSATDILP